MHFPSRRGLRFTGGRPKLHRTPVCYQRGESARRYTRTGPGVHRLRVYGRRTYGRVYRSSMVYEGEYGPSLGSTGFWALSWPRYDGKKERRREEGPWASGPSLGLVIPGRGEPGHRGPLLASLSQEEEKEEGDTLLASLSQKRGEGRGRPSLGLVIPERGEERRGDLSRPRYP